MYSGLTTAPNELHLDAEQPAGEIVVVDVDDRDRVEMQPFTIESPVDFDEEKEL